MSYVNKITETFTDCHVLNITVHYVLLSLKSLESSNNFTLDFADDTLQAIKQPLLINMLLENSK